MPFIERGGMRILFIHIPKTGGTTVEGWLRSLAPLHFYSLGVPPASRCTPQHFRMQDIRNLFQDGYFDYAFTLVRNPYERIASEYRMRAAIQSEGFWQGSPSFSLWLEGVLSRQQAAPFQLDNHIRPQWEFIGSGVEVFRLEDGMEAALGKVAARLGVPRPQPLPRTLSTGDSAIKVQWDHADRLLVQEHYARDFSEFGYST